MYFLIANLQNNNGLMLVLCTICTVEDAPSWLLQMLSSAKDEEIAKICTGLWGVWVWRNKKVWEGKSVTTAIAMDNSSKHIKEWRVKRIKSKGGTQNQQHLGSMSGHRWKPSDPNVLKVNVDASFRSAEASSSVGMVLRNHDGDFLAGKVVCLEDAATIFKAEAIGTR